MHTKVCKNFGADGVILPQTIMSMEKSGGLSLCLKQRIAVTKVAIVGSVGVELIAEAIKRLGFVDIVLVPDNTALPICDVVICSCTEKADCRAIITHYNYESVICAFNFGIGACAVILPPNRELPNFVEDKADSDTVKAMLDYTSGYSRFWNIPGNYWVDDAIKWIGTLEVSTSIGEHTMAAMVTHLLVAIVAGNKVKTYPKFYLSTIANDIN